MEKLAELERLMDAIKINGHKFYEHGNKAAGTRLRNALMDLKNEATLIRKDVQEVKKARG